MSSGAESRVRLQLPFRAEARKFEFRAGPFGGDTKLANNGRAERLEPSPSRRQQVRPNKTTPRSGCAICQQVAATSKGPPGTFGAGRIAVSIVAKWAAGWMEQWSDQKSERLELGRHPGAANRWPPDWIEFAARFGAGGRLGAVGAVGAALGRHLATENGATRGDESPLFEPTDDAAVLFRGPPPGWSPAIWCRRVILQMCRLAKTSRVCPRRGQSSASLEREASLNRPQR